MEASKLTVAVFLSLHLAVAAQAGEVPSVGELDRIQGETIMLKARAKLEEARGELQAKQSAGGMEDGTLPVVKSILGGERRVVATLLYPGNVHVEAVVGDPIPGGYRVTKIYQDVNKVDLAKGKQIYTVGMSTVVPTARAQSAGGSQMGGPVPYVPGIGR